MLKITDEIQVFECDVKCLSDDGVWVGGLCPYIRNIQTGVDIQTNSNVNSMKLFQDKVLFGEASGKLGIINKDGKEEGVVIHKDNICALSCSKDQILTGSWDHLAVLLTPTSDRTDVCIDGQFYRKKEFQHPQTVWKVRFIDENTFITACADRAIRIFENGSLKTTIRAHANVVRGISVVSGHIYSVDNYGKLLKITMDGEIVGSRNLNEMCFDVCEYKGMIVVCGEHGKIFVTSLNLEVITGKKLGCGTCWGLKEIEGRLSVSGSDGAIYFIDIKEEQMIDESNKAIDESNKAIEESNKVIEESNKVIEDMTEEEERDMTEVKSTKKRVEDSEFVSEGVRYRVTKGKIYKEIKDGWELVGDAEGSYDHRFDVELGEKKYVLSFNDDENPHEVASRFLYENKLSQEHHKEIVDYINANFRSSSRFKRYEGINIEGISKVIRDSPILEMVKKVGAGTKYSIFRSGAKNVYQIEKHLYDFEKIPLFIILDISKYLWAKNVPLDLSFLFRHEYKDRKEAKAFVFLMTNMVEDPPFDLRRLDKKIQILKDTGYLELNDVMNYDENCKIKS